MSVYDANDLKMLKHAFNAVIAIPPIYGMCTNIIILVSE